MNPVITAMSKFTTAAVVVANIILFEPKAIERVLELLELNVPVVKLNPFNVIAPFVNVVASVAPNVKALPKLQPPPTPLNVMAPFNVTALVVIVLPVVVLLKVIVPVLLHTVPALKFIEPETASVGAVPVANVTVPAETVISRQVKAPVIVTV